MIPISAHLTLHASVVNVAERTIDGVAIRYNTVGTPDIGPALFLFGSIRVPADRAAVKLLVQHNRQDVAAGYLLDHIDSPEGMAVRFILPAGEAGDQALAQAADKTRDGLSVGVLIDDYRINDAGVIEVRSSQLREVSLVTIPAFADSRVTSVTWVSPTESEQPMFVPAAAPTLPLAASGVDTPLAPAAAPAAPAVATPAPVEATPAPAPISAPALITGAPELLASDQLANLAKMLAPHFAASTAAPATPAGSPAPTPPKSKLTLQGAAQITSQWANAGSGNIHELLAALSDVVPGDDAGLGFTREQWLGEVWKASQQARPWIDSLGAPKLLTKLKVTGWRWATLPVVGVYAGDKAAIPSNVVATEAAEATATRVAGGWDVDRAFVDLGDPGFIQALFEAATADYRRKSDTAVGAILETAAAVNDITGTEFFQILNGMAAAAMAIGAKIDAVAVGTGAWAALSALTKDQVPWWFSGAMDLGSQSGSVNPNFRFFVTGEIGANAVIGYDARVATYYEAGATPIRVQAENIGNGGVDLGVFGYHATIVNDPRAIWNGVIVP